VKTTRRYIVTVPAETRGYGEKARILPALTCEVALTIDAEALVAKLARGAARGKTGKSVEAGGLVQCKVIAKREVAA
jgi:hypothetical protein